MLGTLWYWAAAFAAACYVVSDGFDLGAGVLHRAVARTDDERRTVLGAIGPYWDGNEVWLLVTGGVLFLAFPRALGVALSGFYLPIMVLLWLLILRGIAIEFRSHHDNPLWRSFFDTVFLLASVGVATLLGAALANLVRGVPLDHSGWFQMPLFTDFTALHPAGVIDWYTLLVGVFALVALAMHGALFLAWKTAGPVHDRSRRLVMPLWSAVSILVVLVTFATAATNPTLFPRLVGRPFAWPLALVWTVALGAIPVMHRRGREVAAFCASAAFLFALLAATAACLFPTLIPSQVDRRYDMTIASASSSTASQRAGLWWWALGIPLALAYFSLLLRIHGGRIQRRSDEPGY